MCGSATHRFYLTALESPDEEFLCFNCYRLFVQKEKLHPKIAEKKSIQADQFQKKDYLAEKFLSYFFIGFNDLWRGSSLKGLLLLFVFFIFILRFIFWEGVLPDFLLQASPSWWGALIWGGLFILFYILSIRRGRRQKPAFEVQK